MDIYVTIGNFQQTMIDSSQQISPIHTAIMPPINQPREGATNNNGPPQPNPVLTAYESYLRDTPLITRYVLNATVISFITGFFFNPAYLLANIPIFTIFKKKTYSMSYWEIIFITFIIFI